MYIFAYVCIYVCLMNMCLCVWLYGCTCKIGGIDFDVLKGFALEDKGKSLLKKKIIPSRNAIGAIEEEGKKKMGVFLRDPLNLPFSLSDGMAVSSGEEGVRSSVSGYHQYE